jgi:hypothetical protein
MSAAPKASQAPKAPASAAPFPEDWTDPRSDRPVNVKKLRGEDHVLLLGETGLDGNGASAFYAGSVPLWLLENESIIKKNEADGRYYLTGKTLHPFQPMWKQFEFFDKDEKAARSMHARHIHFVLMAVNHTEQHMFAKINKVWGDTKPYYPNGFDSLYEMAPLASCSLIDQIRRK